MPELRQLRAFVAVAQELNFTRAAERLHLGQQAVSKSVRQLERELGVTLLERTTREVRLTAAGARPGDIASELGLAKSTVAFHLRNLGAGNPRPYGGRCAIVETLGRSGVRASELCDLRLGDVRLGDGRFVIRDSKTEAGVREVQMTPDLVDAFPRDAAEIEAIGELSDGRYLASGEDGLDVYADGDDSQPYFTIPRGLHPAIARRLIDTWEAGYKRGLANGGEVARRDMRRMLGVAQ